MANLRVWGGDCETRVEPDFKRAGLGRNAGAVGRRDPLGFGTVRMSPFSDPSVAVGRKGTHPSRGERSG